MMNDDTQGLTMKTFARVKPPSHQKATRIAPTDKRERDPHGPRVPPRTCREKWLAAANAEFNRRGTRPKIALDRRFVWSVITDTSHAYDCGRVGASFL
jgi:hypothetical protein